MRHLFLTLLLIASAAFSHAQTVTIAAASATMSEGGGATVNFRISRAGSGAITMNFAVSGTATNGADYAAIGASVFMPTNTSPVNVPLTPIEDGAVEGDETVTITLLPGAGYTLGATTTATITITDNETAEYGRLANLPFGSWVNGNGQTVPLRLDLYTPLDTPGPWPVVLYVFGGAWSVGGRSAVGARELSLCAKGYAVAAMDYRYSQDAIWPAQIHDIKGSIRWLRAHAAEYQLDPARFAVTGPSSGGHLSACVGAMSGVPTVTVYGVTCDLRGSIGGNLDQSDAVQAAVPFYPPTDFLRMDHYITFDHNAANSPESHLIGAALQTAPAQTAAANPALFARGDGPPFLIFHGGGDGSVPFNQSEILHDALIRAGARVTFFPQKMLGHGGSGWSNPPVVDPMHAFLDRVLKGANANALPVPRFTASAATVPAGTTVNFDATTSTDAEGGIARYAWSFGDNKADEGAQVSFRYAKPGTYRVTLCVEDEAHGCASTSQLITVTQPGANTLTPVVALTDPPDGVILLETAAVHFAADATATGATVRIVEFFVNGTLRGHDSTAPFGLSLGGLAAGNYRIVARAVDDLGGVTLSAPRTFTVLPAQPEARSIEAEGARYLGVSFHRIPAAANVTHRVEWSPDLATWSEGATNEVSRTATDGIETVIVRAQTSTTATPRGFLRVRKTFP